MSNSSFREIDSWDSESFIERFVPPNSILVMTENSNLIMIIENKKNKYKSVSTLSFLDRIAQIIGKGGHFSAFRKRMTISKDDAQKISNILIDQSKKLKAMAETYNLMAVALLASKDNFEDVMRSTNVIKDNPFE